MILWKKDTLDADAIHNQVSKTYKIENPERIQGYTGYFNFHFGEIWIDELIEEIIKKDAKFETLLEELLKRLRSNDYGDISQDDKDLNMENRYFFGCFIGLKGVYKTTFGIINIKIVDKNSTHITISK